MILLIDNYDSFTYNLYQYLGEFDEVKVFRNDEITASEILKIDPDKIVISPGPKTPDEAGNCIEFIKTFYKKIPILGICLGHQCIGRAFGGEITYAKKLYHGKTSMIKHNQKGIFKGLQNPIQVARYHSLAINKDTLCKEFEINAATDDGEIMAISHKEYPLYGLQFHPESVYTPEGMEMIKNFIEGGDKDD
ncbi:aminodeoxychorismate/anthranilate synthase component II [Clostridium aestuarii]|uniref:Aminodeoxychorismate/anthranilate synthase component II n=1 Tax=Clostridium aestuarii TaxID=338193 RepID=A0ABT4CW52_9CLOT|nr:aminodeoxychorismate/anthranilate synthase component II [Clostridium aestuarii]MCY6483210.1 aminodeoxychorismate/anthranilate synthase component II [Clostridium aestuarii]